MKPCAATAEPKNEANWWDAAGAGVVGLNGWAGARANQQRLPLFKKKGAFVLGCGC